MQKLFFLISMHFPCYVESKCLAIFAGAADGVRIVVPGGDGGLQEVFAVQAALCIIDENRQASRPPPELSE